MTTGTELQTMDDAVGFLADVVGPAEFGRSYVNKSVALLILEDYASELWHATKSEDAVYAKKLCGDINGYFCTRLPGHTGLHVASDGDSVLKIWETLETNFLITTHEFREVEAQYWIDALNIGEAKNIVWSGKANPVHVEVIGAEAQNIRIVKVGD